MKSLISAGIGIAVLLAMAVGTPPGGMGWGALYAEDSPTIDKAVYLMGVYAFPAGLAFAAIVLFQLQARISMSGAAVGVVFLAGVCAWSLLLQVFRNAGQASQPGYVLGMAAGFAMMSRVYVVTLGRSRLGIRWPRVVWRGDSAQIKEFRERLNSISDTTSTKCRGEC